MAKTIDNLGIEDSRRFAEDNERLREERESQRSAPYVRRRTEVGVSTPYAPSQTDTLLEVKRGISSWAEVAAPPNFGEPLSRNIYTSQLLTSLGNEDRREQVIQRIKALIQASEEKSKESPAAWLQELAEEKEESSRILRFFQNVGLLETLYATIMKERNRYRKG